MDKKITIFLCFLFLIFLSSIIFYTFIFSQKYLLLSFDTELTDNNQTILNLINILSKHNATATFFITIDFAKENPELIYLIQNTGNEIACHSVDHPYLTKLNYSQKYYQINGCKDYLKKEFNISVIGFRAPYRFIDFTSFCILKKTNYNYDASIFSGLKVFYPNFFIKEIYTSSYGLLPIDDYVLFNLLHLNSKTYFWLLNNYNLPYKSFSFHPHLIMEHPKEFENFLSNNQNIKISHKEYLEVIP